MEKKQFGEKLKEMIKETGLTQRDFSARLGVNESAMTRYLKGEREPRADLLWKISRTFNVSLDYFNEKPADKPPFATIKEVVCRNGNALSEDERLELIKLLSQR